VYRAENENRRLAAVDSYQLVGAPRAEILDGVPQLAASVFDAPMASVTLVHEDRQWFAGRVGLNEPGTSRANSFSARLIDDPRPLVVSDTRDDPFYRLLPHVTRTPSIRFYAGVPLIDPDGQVLGAVAVFDRVPRPAGVAQMDMLSHLAGQASAHLQSIRTARLVDGLAAELDRLRARDAEAASAISHELRTPVAAMTGFLELLLELPELAAYRPLLDPVKREGRHLVGLVERIVDTVTGEHQPV
jgi:GAF domain-containing protein